MWEEFKREMTFKENTSQTPALLRELMMELDQFSQTLLKRRNFTAVVK